MKPFIILIFYAVLYIPCCVVLRSNKNVTLTLAWNLIPNAGTLPKVSALGGGHRLEFPDEYATGTNARF